MPQCLQAQGHGCFWDFLPLPAPEPVGAAVSPLPGLLVTLTHPYGAPGNQVLGQTPPWGRHCATTEWGLPAAEDLGGCPPLSSGTWIRRCCRHRDWLLLLLPQGGVLPDV